MGDDHPCNVKGIGTVRVKMFDGSEVCSSTQNEFYLCWCFKNIGSCGIYTRWYSQDDKGSIVVMKGVRRNNLYYLKGSTVAGRVETSISSDNVCTHV